MTTATPPATLGMAVSPLTPAFPSFAIQNSFEPSFAFAKKMSNAEKGLAEKLISKRVALARELSAVDEMIRIYMEESGSAFPSLFASVEDSAHPLLSPCLPTSIRPSTPPSAYGSPVAGPAQAQEAPIPTLRLMRTAPSSDAVMDEAQVRRRIDRVVQAQPVEPVVPSVVPVKPRQILVQRRRGTVTILKWGAPPFGIESTIEGPAFVPNDFEVQTYSDGVSWLAQTKVDVRAEKSLHYRFVRADRPEAPGPWHTNASGAYRLACETLVVADAAVKRDVKSGGRLVIGVTYPPVQQQLLKVFPQEIAALRAKIQEIGPGAMSVLTRKTPRKRGAYAIDEGEGEEAAKRAKGGDESSGEEEVEEEHNSDRT